MPYAGILDFEDYDDEFRVERLIIRPDAIAFNAICIMPEYGKCDIDTVLRLEKEENVYISDQTRLTYRQYPGENESITLKLTLVEQTEDNSLNIEGLWIQGGEEYSFSGELEKAN